MVASELRDDDQPIVALKLMSVVDHNLDPHFIFFFKCLYVYIFCFVSADLRDLTYVPTLDHLMGHPGDTKYFVFL